MGSRHNKLYRRSSRKTKSYFWQNRKAARRKKELLNGNVNNAAQQDGAIPGTSSASGPIPDTSSASGPTPSTSSASGPTLSTSSASGPTPGTSSASGPTPDSSASGGPKKPIQRAAICQMSNCMHVDDRKGCRFFKMPTHDATYRVWLNRFKADKLPAKGSYICTCHFYESVDVKPSKTWENQNQAPQLNVTKVIKNPPTYADICDLMKHDRRKVVGLPPGVIKDTVFALGDKPYHKACWIVSCGHRRHLDKCETFVRFPRVGTVRYNLWLNAISQFLVPVGDPKICHCHFGEGSTAGVPTFKMMTLEQTIDSLLSRRRKKIDRWNEVCWVPTCQCTRNECKCFYPFPRRALEFYKWLAAVKHFELPTSDSVVCSCHFETSGVPTKDLPTVQYWLNLLTSFSSLPGIAHGLNLEDAIKVGPADSARDEDLEDGDKIVSYPSPVDLNNENTLSRTSLPSVDIGSPQPSTSTFAVENTGLVRAQKKKKPPNCSKAPVVKIIRTTVKAEPMIIESDDDDNPLLLKESNIQVMREVEPRKYRSKIPPQKKAPSKLKLHLEFVGPNLPHPLPKNCIRVVELPHTTNYNNISLVKITKEIREKMEKNKRILNLNSGQTNTAFKNPANASILENLLQGKSTVVENTTSTSGQQRNFNDENTSVPSDVQFKAEPESALFFDMECASFRTEDSVKEEIHFLE